MNRSGITLDEAQRSELDFLSRQGDHDAELASRAKIVIGLADGLSTPEVAKYAGTNKDAVGRWRDRWLESGLDGLGSRHGGGSTPTEEPGALQARIRAELDTNPTAARNRKALAEAVGVDVPRLSRELKRMGLTTERRTSWEVAALAGMRSRSACLAGLFLSGDERCAVVCCSDGMLAGGAETLSTRNRLLGEALASAGAPITLEDALWTAADHAGDPGKKRPAGLRPFVEAVAASAPAGPGCECHAVVLSPEPPTWRGSMPRGLALHVAADADEWDAMVTARLEGLFGLDGSREAASLIRAVDNFCVACLPGTDPIAWRRDVADAGAWSPVPLPSPAAIAAMPAVAAATNAGAVGAPSLAEVLAALAEEAGSLPEGEVRMSMLAIAQHAGGIDCKRVDAPVPFPDASAFDFSSTEGVVDGFDEIEAPVTALRNEAGIEAARLFAGVAKKNSTRRG